MIIYSPIDGSPLKSSIASKPRHCFLMTRLGTPIPQEVLKIRESIAKLCAKEKYEIIDASAEVTGRDFLLKIWELIAASPISIGICHEALPVKTQLNIFYELGVAQALGKETIIIKSENTEIPSDFVRTEHIEFNDKFEDNFLKYLSRVERMAEYYETVADQLEGDPLLAIDYLKRAFLISGSERLRRKARTFSSAPGFQNRAKSSVEMRALSF